MAWSVIANFLSALFFSHPNLNFPESVSSSFPSEEYFSAHNRIVIVVVAVVVNFVEDENEMRRHSEKIESTVRMTVQDYKGANVVANERKND
jgi:hypothetical protein